MRSGKMNLSPLENSSVSQREDDLRVLAERAREGDRDAFTTLFLRIEQAAMSLALQITNNREDAEEVVQIAALQSNVNKLVVWVPGCVGNFGGDRERLVIRRLRILVAEIVNELLNPYRIWGW